VPDALPRKARLAVFASGAGSNLEALCAAFPPSDPDAMIALVISDRADAGALQRAERRGIPARFLAFGRDRISFESAADALLREAAIDWIALAGFMRILSSDFVQRHRGRIVNVHPSLLPAHPGMHAIERALAAGDVESGCTVHYVDEGVDTGAVIAQARVPIEPHDDAASLRARIQAAEHALYPRALRALLRSTVAR
jgi:phosphoribosylglycinamide formyltransferase 1